MNFAKKIGINMKKSAHEILKKAKEQNFTEEQTKELMIKEGIITKKIFYVTFFKKK